MDVCVCVCVCVCGDGGAAVTGFHIVHARDEYNDVWMSSERLHQLLTTATADTDSNSNSYGRFIRELPQRSSSTVAGATPVGEFHPIARASAQQRQQRQQQQQQYQQRCDGGEWRTGNAQ